MTRHVLSGAVLLALVSISAQPVQAHCQVPCGIYGDSTRVRMMREDLATIIRAMGQIRALSQKKDAQSQNQLVRWVVTKEQHAEKIIRTISDYFMAQKIKPAKAGYAEMLKRHHAVMVAAMTCKQTTDGKAARALGKALDTIANYWPSKHKCKHKRR